MLCRHSRLTKAQKLSPIYPNLLENYTEDLLPDFPVEYIGPSSFCNLINEYQNTSDGNLPIKFLDIALKDIQFKHHHDFSLEDILCIKLIEVYSEYEKLDETLKNLAHDIKVNRGTKDNLRKDLLKVSPNKKDDIRFDATIRKYTGQLLLVKEKYKEALKVKKELIHKIVSIWSDIEMAREKFECTNTPYNLKIVQQTLNEKEYNKAWDDLYENEWTDMLAKIEYEYETKCIEYKESKQEESLDSSSRKKIIKPKINIDEDAIKEKVEKIVNSIIVKERIDFSLEKDERRATELKVPRHIYHFEIYVDNAFVCESEQHISIDKWHNVNFNEYFSIEILPNNQTLRILLLENEEILGELKANLSEFQRKGEDNNFSKLKFIYDKDIAPTRDLVGSGHSIKEIAATNKVRLKSSNTFIDNLTTTCEVNAKIKWSENFNQTQNESMKASLIIGNKLKRFLHGIDKPNVRILIDIIGKIYGKDVTQDETILNTLNQLCKLDFKINEEFEIDENSAEFVRLKLLHLRNSGGFTEVQNKIIPIHGSQISTEQLNCLQKTKEKDFDLDYLREKEADMDPIELQRFIGAKFMQKLNKKMLRNLNEHLMVKTRKDVLREFRDFNWRSV